MAKVALKRIPNVCECGNHAWVNLTRWGVALVSPQDAWLFLERPWQLMTANVTLAYAQSSGEGLLHRRVMVAKPGEIVDHESGNGLDNRRSNLRVATSADNMANARKRKGTASKFKGVCCIKRPKTARWSAVISLNNRSKHLGEFILEEDAARAYDAAALLLRGEFAKTNVALGLLQPL